MHQPAATCAHCRQPAPLITVVDETGSTGLCGLCCVQVIADLERTGDLTVLVARPTVAV